MYKDFGLDKFEKSLLNTLKVKFPQEVEKFLLEMAYRLDNKTKKRTPRDSGKLINSWRVGKVKKIGDEFFLEYYNNTEYAPHVEYGHRTRNGGFVKGRKMLTVSVKEIEKEMPSHIRKLFDKALRELKL